MRRTAVLALLLAAAASWAQDAPLVTVDTLPKSLGGTWLFRAGHDPAWASPFRERRNWQRIEVPGAWESEGLPRYTGNAWYRLPLFLPSQLAGQDLGLDLGLVADADEVFINGHKAGQTGGFPPRFANAQLAHRFYELPADALRFGEYNELAVHVYNEGPRGGLLGPPPRIDLYPRILGRAVLRDVVSYCLLTVLLLLAAFQLFLFAAQRERHDHLWLAAFFVVCGLLELTYAHWGPAALVGATVNDRLNVAAFLLAVALFPSVIIGLARQTTPASVMALQTLFVLGAAFALAWRTESDLVYWVRGAEAAVALIALISVRPLRAVMRRDNPLGPWLLATSVLFLALVGADILVHIGFLPRRHMLLGDLYSPLALFPFAVVLTLSSAREWVEHQWGEPADVISGIVPKDRVMARLGLEMERSRRTGSAFAFALVRLAPLGPDQGDDHRVTAAILALRRSLRQLDMLGRYDHDTLAIILAETEERAAVATLERLRRTIADEGEGAHRADATVGVSQFRNGRHATAGELLEETEAALYAALSEGGGCTASAP